MRTRRYFQWLIACWTILALSWGVPLKESYAQGGTADTAASTTADEGGGTCDGCLDAVEAQGDGQGDRTANRDFITGISARDRDDDETAPAPSVAVFSLAMLAIGTAAFFVRRWFALPV